MCFPCLRSLDIIDHVLTPEQLRAIGRISSLRRLIYIVWGAGVEAWFPTNLEAFLASGHAMAHLRELSMPLVRMERSMVQLLLRECPVLETLEPRQFASEDAGLVDLGPQMHALRRLAFS